MARREAPDLADAGRCRNAGREAFALSGPSSAAAAASPATSPTISPEPTAALCADCARCSCNCRAGLALAGRAFQVAEWDRTPPLLRPLRHADARQAGERAKECPACGYTAYPRMTPAMMVLVTRGVDLLLAARQSLPPGMYSALAGFVEAGETIEDCIQREVREEVGIEVTRPPLLPQPVVAVPALADDRLTPPNTRAATCALDAEIADARWFCLDAVPQLPSPISVSRRLIDATIERLRGARPEAVLAVRTIRPQNCAFDPPPRSPNHMFATPVARPRRRLLRAALAQQAPRRHRGREHPARAAPGLTVDSRGCEADQGTAVRRGAHQARRADLPATEGSAGALPQRSRRNRAGAHRRGDRGSAA